MTGSLLNKVEGLQPTTLSKSRQHRCFPVNFAKFREYIFYKIPPGETCGNSYL